MIEGISSLMNTILDWIIKFLRLIKSFVPQTNNIFWYLVIAAILGYYVSYIVYDKGNFTKTKLTITLTILILLVFVLL